ncbi:MAG: SPASM domain-containing protein [Bacteriovoracaceae bacterium]|nr:SPASM domain-containing protein [Bacteriovoracaceae bacterium]
MQEDVPTYEKKNSFNEFNIVQSRTTVDEQVSRVIKILSENKANNRFQEVLSKAFASLKLQAIGGKSEFYITPFIADELSTIEDEDIPKYIFHRYRYDIFPAEKQLDEFPPYLQIEPSSICNFRCVFCYQTDKSFNSDRVNHMGSMTFQTYKKIVDMAEGNIEFLSLASRGEPLICKDFNKMMEYSVGKFLNLKVNTNASLMSESNIHALLCGGAKTIVFSADAAVEPLYSKLRVNGNLDKVLKNIEKFQNIRDKQYSKLKVITRVSGVFVSEEQDMDQMVNVWGDLVDQVSFVKYNPWENVYDSPETNISTPCSDLWRRMFVWFDGKVNPCDTDYKSHLATGNINESNISDIWLGHSYNRLREKHQEGNRKNISPCKKCSVL